MQLFNFEKNDYQHDLISRKILFVFHQSYVSQITLYKLVYTIF